jgi:hypothetical protein
LCICEENEEVDTERGAITAGVPAYQKEGWVKEADKLDMSRSEYLRTMIQACRHDLGIAEDIGPVRHAERSIGSNQEERINDSHHRETSSEPSTLGSGGLKAHPLEDIRREEILSVDDLVTTTAGDIEEQLHNGLADLQSSDHVRYNGREEGLHDGGAMSTGGRPEDSAQDDPIGYFVENMNLQGKSERTREEYNRVLRRFESFLHDPARGLSKKVRGHSEASDGDCVVFVSELRQSIDIADSTTGTYAAHLHRFYADMNERDTVEANPMAFVIEEFDERIDTGSIRREISISRMREFVAEITHPVDRALVFTLAKTGIHVGELYNLDLRGLKLSFTASGGNGDRSQLDGRPDSL